LQGFLLQVEVSQIMVHEAGEPNTVVDFLDAELLSSQHGGEVDPFAMQAKPITRFEARSTPSSACLTRSPRGSLRQVGITTAVTLIFRFDCRLNFID
jgi:hypothetical protein